jgi:hypothetical protein
MIDQLLSAFSQKPENESQMTANNKIGNFAKANYLKNADFLKSNNDTAPAYSVVEDNTQLHPSTVQDNMQSIDLKVEGDELKENKLRITSSGVLTITKQEDIQKWQNSGLISVQSLRVFNISCEKLSNLLKFKAISVLPQLALVNCTFTLPMLGNILATTKISELSITSCNIADMVTATQNLTEVCFSNSIEKLKVTNMDLSNHNFMQLTKMLLSKSVQKVNLMENNLTDSIFTLILDMGQNISEVNVAFNSLTNNSLLICLKKKLKWVDMSYNYILLNQELRDSISKSESEIVLECSDLMNNKMSIIERVTQNEEGLKESVKLSEHHIIAENEDDILDAKKLKIRSQANHLFDLKYDYSLLLGSNSLENLQTYSKSAKHSSKVTPNLTVTGPLIHSCVSTLVNNLNICEKSILSQFELLIEQLKLIGCSVTDVSESPSLREYAIVSLASHTNKISDIRPVQFNLEFDEESITVKFVVSSDWYSNYDRRCFKLAVDNVDLITYVLSHLNFNSDNYNFYYEQRNKKHNEILFKSSFCCFEGMDIISETVRLIDIGYIINKTLFEEGLLDHSDTDSEKIRLFCLRISAIIERRTNNYYDSIQHLMEHNLDSC